MALPRSKRFNRGHLHGLIDNVVWRLIGDLKKYPGNPRRHPESQIAGLMKSIRRFWTNPILVRGRHHPGRSWPLGSGKAPGHDRGPDPYDQWPERVREAGRSDS